MRHAQVAQVTQEVSIPFVGDTLKHHHLLVTLQTGMTQVSDDMKCCIQPENQNTQPVFAKILPGPRQFLKSLRVQELADGAAEKGLTKLLARRPRRMALAVPRFHHSVRPTRQRMGFKV